MADQDADWILNETQFYVSRPDLDADRAQTLRRWLRIPVIHAYAGDYMNFQQEVDRIEDLNAAANQLIFRVFPYTPEGMVFTNVRLAFSALRSLVYGRVRIPNDDPLGDERLPLNLDQFGEIRTRLRALLVRTIVSQFFPRLYEDVLTKEFARFHRISADLSQTLSMIGDPLDYRYRQRCMARVIAYRVFFFCAHFFDVLVRSRITYQIHNLPHVMRIVNTGHLHLYGPNQQTVVSGNVLTNTDGLVFPNWFRNQGGINPQTIEAVVALPTDDPNEIIAADQRQQYYDSLTANRDNELTIRTHLIAWLQLGGPRRLVWEHQPFLTIEVFNRLPQMVLMFAEIFNRIPCYQTQQGWHAGLDIQSLRWCAVEDLAMGDPYPQMNAPLPTELNHTFQWRSIFMGLVVRRLVRDHMAQFFTDMANLREQVRTYCSDLWPYISPIRLRNPHTEQPTPGNWGRQTKVRADMCRRVLDRVYAVRQVIQYAAYENWAQHYENIVEVTAQGDVIVHAMNNDHACGNVLQNQLTFPPNVQEHFIDQLAAAVIAGGAPPVGP